MSWNDYAAYLRQNNTCAQAAIIGADDGALWASDGFTVTYIKIQNHKFF